MHLNINIFKIILMNKKFSTLKMNNLVLVIINLMNQVNIYKKKYLLVNDIPVEDGQIQPINN